VSGELVEVREDFEADAMLLVKEFGYGFVSANVRAERVGAQGSPMPKRSLPEQPLYGVERESWVARETVLIEVGETFSRPTFVPARIEDDGALFRELPVSRRPCFEVVDAHRVVGVSLGLMLYVDHYAGEEQIFGVELVRSSFSLVEMARSAPQWVPVCSPTET
jgi:hypothetical protein